jgi:hypothetical protein
LSLWSRHMAGLLEGYSPSRSVSERQMLCCLSLVTRHVLLGLQSGDQPQGAADCRHTSCGLLLVVCLCMSHGYLHEPERMQCVSPCHYYHAAAAAAARYVWLGATSAFKAESDLLKYEKARKLKDYIHDIRKNYKRDWESSDVRKKQVRRCACCAPGRKPCCGDGCSCADLTRACSAIEDVLSSSYIGWFTAWGVTLRAVTCADERGCVLFGQPGTVINCPC